MKNTLIFALVYFQLQLVSAFCGTDLIISMIPEFKTQDCKSAGFCYAYGYNPETTEYEYFHGFHNDCPGNQQKQDDRYTCQRSDLSTYENVVEGIWGICSIY